MRDQSAEPFTEAEARLASRMHRWTDHGVVEIDAADIATRATTAAHPGRLARARSWPGTRSQRAILWLAALLLLAIGSALAAAAALPRSAAKDFRAVVVRQVDGGVDVVLANGDGRERILRHVTPEDLGVDPRHTLGIYSTGQAVSQQGRLELYAVPVGPDRTGSAPYGLTALLDLADPAANPIVVPANGFTGGRWGPDGSWAYFCAGMPGPRLGQKPTDVVAESGYLPDCGQSKGAVEQIGGGPVRVLQPDMGIGSEIIVPHVQTFGGGPEIVWAADGSGFLAQRGSEWGVTPLDGGPFRPGVPEVLSREIAPSRPELEQPLGLELPGGDNGLGPATPISAQLAADGQAIWQLLDDPSGPSPRALLARLTGPGTVQSIRAFALPAGPASWSTLSSDDTFVAIHLQGSDDEGRFVLAPVGDGDATVTTGPIIKGALAGLVPAAIADAWSSR